MTKKSENAPATGASGADAAQSKINELYTAHQVHTLAQLLYRQIVARRSAGPAWTPGNGVGTPSPMNGRPFTSGWTGSHPGMPQPLMYWYP